MCSLPRDTAFSGIAVYVFFIVSNRQPGTITLVNSSFSVDGLHAGDFVHVPLDLSEIEYNVNAFAARGLDNTQHMLLITNNNKVNASNVIFDYLLYT